MIRSVTDFERLDPSLFRAFMAAAETLNFTRAAEHAAMTQSGISQHILKLESKLGVSLFTRSNKSVFLTEAGKQLVLYIEKYLDNMDSIYEQLQNSKKSLTGQVTYAMPGSCLLSPHLSILLDKCQDFPEIQLKILIRTNEEIVHSLEEGHFDFGFITTSIESPNLNLIPFCEEEFVLVKPIKTAIDENDFDDLLTKKFVHYPGMNIYFNAWQSHFYPKIKKRCFERLNFGGSIESIHGAITLVSKGVGCTVIPRHCVEEVLKSKSISVFHPVKKEKPLKNTIYIAAQAGKAPTRRAKQVIDWFLEMHHSS